MGCGIGSGSLGTAYSARLGGFPVIAFWLIVSGILTLISMYYVAESALRTKRMVQLPGLAQRYVGNLGRILLFLAAVINFISCLIAYFNGSGRKFHQILGVSTTVGMIIIILTVASFASWRTDVSRLFVMSRNDAILIFNVAAFSYIGQYFVSHMARSLSHDPKKRLQLYLQARWL